MSRLSDNSVILPYKERCKYHVSLMTIHYPMLSMISSIKGPPLPIACWIWRLNEAVFGIGLQIQRSCAPIALIGWRHFQIYNIIRAKQMHTCGPTLWWHWWRIHMNEINSRRRNFNNVQCTINPSFTDYEGFLPDALGSILMSFFGWHPRAWTSSANVTLYTTLRMK